MATLAKLPVVGRALGLIEVSSETFAVGLSEEELGMAT